jgi:glycosyltransferase involved in cell wall biosynthesis
MIIISDCFTAQIDEGCLKIANSLARKAKAENSETLIISYGRKPSFSDYHLNLNKLFMNKELFSLIRRKNKPVLYIPFASNTLASVLRVFVLTLFGRQTVNLLPALRMDMKSTARALLKLSKANVIALSKESYLYYFDVIGNRAHYFKTGVDTEKFIPVAKKRKIELKKKYGIPEEMNVVLHVGHLKANRNVDKLFGIDSKYYVLLVVSSVTEAEKSASIRERLKNRPNTRIIEEYLENIQEIYQLSDVYVFPVQAVKGCIDIPLSVLEAAACNIPIVTTPYGELNEFIGKEGFYKINTCDKEEMNQVIDTAASFTNIDTRKAIAEYDWTKSISQLHSIVG